ncbi:MAG: YraN family protein [Ilumatobacteraceae bacterium]
MRPGTPDLSNRARGQWGEDRACTLYRRLGYEIVDRNWRCEHGEIDVVARSGDTLVFCEVKTRRSDGFGGAAAAVGHRKQSRIRRLAAAWLAERRVHGVDVRFDVVAITGVDVELIEGAF